MKLISNNFTQSLGEENDVLSILASLKNQADDHEPFFIFKLSEVIDRYSEWKLMLPRVKPYYGNYFMNIDNIHCFTVYSIDKCMIHRNSGHVSLAAVYTF